mgnify:FL=1
MTEILVSFFLDGSSFARECLVSFFFGSSLERAYLVSFFFGSSLIATLVATFEVLLFRLEVFVSFFGAIGEASITVDMRRDCEDASFTGKLIILFSLSVTISINLSFSCSCNVETYSN